MVRLRGSYDAAAKVKAAEKQADLHYCECNCCGHGLFTTKERLPVICGRCNKEMVVKNILTSNRGEGGIMLKVADRATKGTYVAKVVGMDEKFGLKREFLPTELKFTKKKGVAEVFINPEHLKSGDIIALKIVKPGETEGKENYYKIVANPAESDALHNIVKKIPGGKEDVVKIFRASEKDQVEQKVEQGNLTAVEGQVVVATNTKKGSYVARLTGADEKFGFKREFISKTISDKEKKTCLVVAPGDIPKGTVIAMKIVRSGKDDAKENYYQIDKEPTESELHKVVKKITKEEAAAILGIPVPDEKKTLINESGNSKVNKSGPVLTM